MADDIALTEAENQFFETGGAETPEEMAEQIDTEQAPPEDVDPPSSEQPADEPEKKDEKTVPYGALHEERMRRKEASEEAAQMRERIARMEERFQQVMQRQETPEIVDFDEDPAEHLRQKAAMLEKQQAELVEQTRGMSEQQQAAAQEQQFVEAYRNTAQQYARENENFAPAYQFLLESRAKEYAAAGYGQAEVAQFIKQDEVEIARMAFKDGVNPAERLYALAEVRGFKPSAKKETGAEEIDRIEKGQKASRSLSNGRGKAEPPATLESLAEMDDDEFDAKWDEIIGTKASVLG